MKFSQKYIKEVIEDVYAYGNNVDTDELALFLKFLSDAYYNKKALVSDEVFDDLKDILADRDPTNPFLSEIGAPTDKDAVKLPFPMGSFSKIKPGTSEVQKWQSKYDGPYYISDKLDGMSGELYNHPTEGLQLFSRGDGISGKNISHLVGHITGTIDIDIPKGTCVRGEIIISRENFKLIEKEFANARSAAAGLINKKTVNSRLAKLASFVTYNILYPSNITHQKKLPKLKAMGLLTVWYDVVDEPDDLEQTLIDTLKKRRVESPFDIDGLVCYDCSKPYKHEEGIPKYAVAFKMRNENDSVETSVINVEWNVSKHNVLKPTVYFEPVSIGGSTIQYATGHNASYISKNKIGPGAVIQIIKSGDVIPFIADVIKPAKKAQMPDVEFEWNDTCVDIIATNLSKETHDAFYIKQITHFFKTLGVKYMSTGFITKLYNAGYTDIFKIITAKQKDICKLDGIGETSADKVYKEINKALQSVKLHTLMTASLVFGIGLGSTKLEAIVEHIPNIMNITSKKILFESIIAIEGFSDTLTNRFVNNFGAFVEFYKKLTSIAEINITSKKTNKESDESEEEYDPKIVALINDKKIVFTGFRNDALKEIIQNIGGSVTSSVSKNTDLVVYVEEKTQSSKLTKALELDIKTMEKSKFIELLKKHNISV